MVGFSVIFIVRYVVGEKEDKMEALTRDLPVATGDRAKPGVSTKAAKEALWSAEHSGSIDIKSIINI